MSQEASLVPKDGQCGMLWTALDLLDPFGRAVCVAIPKPLGIRV